jgi:hypothetical protein
MTATDINNGRIIARIDNMRLGRQHTHSSRKVRIIPARPIPKRAVEMTRDPKLDQLPTAKIRIT